MYSSCSLHYARLPRLLFYFKINFCREQARGTSCSICHAYYCKQIIDGRGTALLVLIDGRGMHDMLQLIDGRGTTLLVRRTTPSLQKKSSVITVGNSRRTVPMQGILPGDFLLQLHLQIRVWNVLGNFYSGLEKMIGKWPLLFLASWQEPMTK